MVAADAGLGVRGLQRAGGGVVSVHVRPTAVQALEEIKRLHQPIIMPAASDVVCSLCCFDAAGYQTADCLESHEHTFTGPSCSTAEIIARAGL